MNVPINEHVSVITVFNAETRTVRPARLKWRGRAYTILNVGYYHRTRVGRTIVHHYTAVATGITFFLEYNAETLHWTLREIYDLQSAA